MKKIYGLNFPLNFLLKSLFSLIFLSLILKPIKSRKQTLKRLNNLTRDIQKFKIDLNLPVEERYKSILIKYKNHIKAGISYTIATNLNAKILSKIAEFIIKNPSKYDREWFEYIKAVSKYTESSLSQAIVYSITYDMACTSIITQDPYGNIMLSRNLDFGTYFVISHSIFQADYYKNGEFIFSAIELAGFRGVINGLKGNKFAMSLNLRKKNSAIFNIFRIFLSGYFSQNFNYYTPNYFMYKVLLEAENYSDAYNMLKKGKLTAPVYYLLTGIKENEGVLLLRDYDSLDSEEKLDKEKGIWYILVTNNDKGNTKENPESEFRRKSAEEKLKEIGYENINKENIYEKILSKYPNNNLVTAYTSIHTAQNNGFFNTTVWMP